jgi:hypothetical protein
VNSASAKTLDHCLVQNFMQCHFWRLKMLTIPQNEWNLVCGGKGPAGEAIVVGSAIGAGIGVSGSISAAGGLSALSTLGAAISGAAIGGLVASAYAGYFIGRQIGENEWIRGRLCDIMTDWGG